MPTLRDYRVAPAPILHVTKTGANISSATSVVTAVSNKSIVVTDIIVSTGTAADLSVCDDDTPFVTFYLGADGNAQANLSSPIKITAGNDLKVDSSTTNTNSFFLINYYIE
jgi:hypothetical protein